jgi:ubiquinone/menaquinone biosynthesis C-methylase UbiE
MTTADSFRATDKLDDALVNVIVARLEARGKHPMFAQMLADYLDAMEIDRAGRVLDVGCGTGIAARAVARRPGFKGLVLGVDLSPYLADTAGRLAAEEGLAERCEFRAGDTRSLSLEAASFDAVVAHTLVSHVDDPLAALREIARVVKPGGAVGIFDGDYASMTFAQEDPEKTKRDDEILISALVTNPYVMRQMPRLLRAAGLDYVRTFSYVLAEIGQADFWASGIESFRRLLPKSEAMSEDAAAVWADDLTKASNEGVFFGASNYYGYVARRFAG